MATFTVELYRVAELRGTIGLDHYPIFEESYREGLNKKIYDHFIDREIGMENVPKFLHAMERRMNEIMPYYNQMYESQKLAIDPLNTISMSTLANALGTQSTTNASQSETTDNRTSSNNSLSSGKGQVVQSDFPQTQLQNRKDYASAGTDSTTNAASQAEGTDNGKGTAKDSSTGSAQTTDKTDSNIKGWQGSQAMLLMQFRATFLNIDMEIISKLEDLFMFVWTSNDNFTPQNGLY